MRCYANEAWTVTPPGSDEKFPTIFVLRDLQGGAAFWSEDKSSIEEWAKIEGVKLKWL